VRIYWCISDIVRYRFATHWYNHTYRFERFGYSAETLGNTTGWGVPRYGVTSPGSLSGSRVVGVGAVVGAVVGADWATGAIDGNAG